MGFVRVVKVGWLPQLGTCHIDIKTIVQNRRSISQVPFSGEVGFVVAGIKNLQGAPVGDTITHLSSAEVSSLPGFKQVKPQVFAGVFPTSSDDYNAFRDALAKLKLNDASLFFEPENSAALGFGFRIGFLGMLLVIRPGLGVFHPAMFLVLAAATCFALRQIISHARQC